MVLMTCGDRLICSSLQCAHTKTLSPPQHIAIKMPLERGSVGRALLGRTGHRLWGTWNGVCFSRPVRQRTRQVLGPGPLLGPLFSLRSNAARARRQLSNGLVMSLSCGGLTSSRIERRSCCTSPEWPVGGKLGLDHQSGRGLLLLRRDVRGR